LLSELDAAVSGETSLDHESRPEWVVTVRMTGTSIDLLASLKRQVPRARYVSPPGFRADLADREEGARL